MQYRIFVSFTLLFCLSTITTLSDTTTVGGNITANTTWSAVNNPYRVISEVLVFNGAMLTIEAGVTVLFDSGTGLRIGKSGSLNADAGSLIAIGTSTDSIRFIASLENMSQWKGILFDNGSDAGGSNSALAFCVIERAGETNTNADNEKANVFCKNTNTPSIANSTLRNSGKYELYCSNANPSITQSSFSNSTTVAALVFLKTNSSPTFSKSSFTSESASHLLFCDSTSFPTLTNNVFISENAKAMRVGILSQFSANNFSALAKKGIEIIGGTLSANRIWSKQISESTYIVLQRDIAVSNGTNPTLTIDSGVVVKFANVGLRVGGTSNSNEGKLIVNGTITDSVRLTSESGNTNGWKGMLFDDGSDMGGDSSVLKYCIVENAGLPNVYNISANVQTKFSTSTVISHSTIRNAYGYELFCDNSASLKLIQSEIMHFSYVHSILYLKNNSNPAFYNCSFITDSSSYVLYSELSNCSPLVSQCVFSNSYGKSFRVGVLSRILENDVSRVVVKGMEILGGIMNQNRTWKKQAGDSLYVVLGSDISVRSGNNPTLTIDSGVVIKFLGVGLTIGGSTSTDEGILIANGSESQPVYFSSASGTSGGWKGLLFESGSDFNNASSLLSYCVIENAGQLNTYGTAANIYCRNTITPVVQFSIIKNSSGIGVYCSGASPTVKNSHVILNTLYGIDVAGNSSPIVGNTLQYSNDIYGNGQYDVYVEGNQNINARYNYWGTTNLATIAARIFDKTDNASLGEVLFKPFTDSARTVLLPDITPPANPTFATGFSDSLKLLQLIYNSAYNISHPFFIWNKGTDSNSFVAGYSVALTADSADTLQRIVKTNDTSMTVLDDVVKGTNYYFRIRTKDVYENWSNAVSLFRYYYDSLAPAVPMLHFASGGNGNVTLRWNKNADGDFLRYRIFLGINPNPFTQVDSVSHRNDTMKTIFNLPNGTTFYFRITSVDTLFNESNFSNELSATPVQPPTIPTLFFPINGAFNQSLIISLVWNSAVGAETYRLQISSDSSFSTIFLDDSSITATSRQVETLSIATNYYWRVKAKNAGGISDWSQRWKFKTVSLPKFSIHKSFISFDSVYVDSVQTDSVLVSNTGTEVLHIHSASINNQFSVVPTNDSIIPSTAKTFFITFHPTSAGNKTGTIVFTHDGLTSPDTVLTSGFAVQPLPIFSVNRDSLQLGNVVVDSIKFDSVAITNSGIVALKIFSIASDDSFFSVVPTSDSIAPSATKQFIVSFQPNTIGYTSANIIVTHNALSTTDTLVATGTGIAPAISLSTMLLSLDSVLVNRSRNDSFFITNHGTATLAVSSITCNSNAFTMTPINFFIEPDDTQKVFVTFTPSNAISYNGIISIEHNAPGNPSSLIVTGAGTAPAVSITPASLFFNEVIVSTSKPDSLIITNTGTAELVATNITSTHFTYSIAPTSFVLSPNQNKKIYVSFSPVARGTVNASVNIFHNAAGGSTNVPVSGVGIAPQIVLVPSSLSFGNVIVHQIQQDSFSVANSGAAPLEVTNMFSSDSTFSVYPINFIVAPSESRIVLVTFSPTSTGNFSGQIVLTHNATGTPDSVFVFGNGIPVPSPAISYSPLSLSFDSVVIQTPKRDSFFISNVGNAQLIVSSIFSDNNVFSVDTNSFSIAPSATQKVFVTFFPVALSSFSGNIIVLHNANGSPDTINAFGRGIPPPSPAFFLSHDSLLFGNIRLHTSKTDSIVIRNTGTALLSGKFFNDDSAFVLSSDTFSLPSNEKQKITVTFTPDSARQYRSNILISHNANGSPDTVILLGTGKPFPMLYVSNTSLWFGSVLAGNTKSDTVVIQNKGTASLQIYDIEISNNIFSTRVQALTIAANDSHLLSVQFTPINDGVFQSTLMLSHDADGSPTTLLLSGVGKKRLNDGELQTTIGYYYGGIHDSQWQLMSIPMELDNKSVSILRSQLSGENPWKIISYVNGEFKDISNSGNAFQLTRGFWFKTVAKNQRFHLHFGSGQLVSSQSYNITIPSGWSLIGSPFYPQDASWSPVNIDTNSVGVRVYQYNVQQKKWEGPLNPAGEKLQPFGGYAVWNGTGANTAFTFLRNETRNAVPEFQNGDGWFAKIEVGNSVLRIGQHRNAKDKTDVYDYPMAPTNPEMKSDEAYLAGKLWSDVYSQQMNGLKRWKVYINPKTSREIKLKEIFGLPGDWKIVVSGIPAVKEQELNDGEVISLPKNISVPFVAEILVGKSDLLENEKPKEFSLQQNYPNPFNPTTNLRFQIADFGFVSLKIYNMLGQEIAILFDGNLETGNYNFIWEGNNNNGELVGSGIYFARLTTSNFTKTIKMELLK